MAKAAEKTESRPRPVLIGVLGRGRETASAVSLAGHNLLAKGPLGHNVALSWFIAPPSDSLLGAVP